MIVYRRGITPPSRYQAGWLAGVAAAKAGHPNNAKSLRPDYRAGFALGYHWGSK